MDILNATKELNATKGLNATKELCPDQPESVAGMFVSILMFAYIAHAGGLAEALTLMNNVRAIRIYMDTTVYIELMTIVCVSACAIYTFFYEIIPIRDEMAAEYLVFNVLTVCVDVCALVCTIRVRRDIINTTLPRSGGERKDDAYRPLISPESEIPFVRA